MHRTLKLEEALTGNHARVAQLLVEHHRHIAAVYGFVKDSLGASQPAERELEAVRHVRAMETCADLLEKLEPGLEPHARVAFHLYLAEVAKVARVVRMETPYLETDAEHLQAALEGAVGVLKVAAKSQNAVDKSHSDTAV